METKLDKLDKLSRALQQERSELQSTIKNLSKPATTTENTVATPQPDVVPSTMSCEAATNGHDASKIELGETLPTDTNELTPTPESPNLYGSSLLQ